MVSPGKQQPSRKVLVLAPSLEVTGGIQRHTKTLIRALRELLGEKAVHALTLEPKRRKSKRGKGKAAPGSTSGIGAGAKALFICRALWGTIAWRPDLVIAAHVGFAPLAWLLGALSRCRYWVFAHGIEVWGALTRSKRSALVRSTRIIAVSDFTRRRLVERQLVSEDRALILPNAAENPPSPQTDLRASLLAGQGRRVVLTVSRLASAERYKGHDVLLQALVYVRHKVPDVLYLVVGEGDDRVRLEEQAQQLNLGNSVRFLGEVSDEMLAACYDLCEVFAMPSRTELNGSVPKGEGFGIVYLEAMMRGKPVIGPNYGAPTEFIRHGEHGLLVNPEDPEAVAAALVELLDSPQRARRMGEAAREWVMGEYSYLRFVERLGTLLRE